MYHESLNNDIENNTVTVEEAKLPGRLKGLYADSFIVIDAKLSTSEKNCILAEELGHYHTSFGNILDLTDVRNKKQELRARAWGYERLIPLEGLIKAFKLRISSKHDLADFFNVTEEFLSDSIIHYCRKYGEYKKVGNFVIYFDPLAILEVWE